jgi:hypothetical protein
MAQNKIRPQILRSGIARILEMLGIDTKSISGVADSVTLDRGIPVSVVNLNWHLAADAGELTKMHTSSVLAIQLDGMFCRATPNPFTLRVVVPP